jgi:P4 family phage/plasmid primase-like protien
MKTAKKPPNALHQNPKETNTITLTEYLKSHRIQGESKSLITNTRIGKKEIDIWGGSYNIKNYKEFLAIYYRDVFVRGQPEYLTETQIEKGPLLVDVDLRHDYAVTSRQYTLDHIANLIYLYLGIFKKIFQLDDEVKIETYLFQKPSVNRVVKDKITKDGAHLIFTIACDHTVQELIRKKVLDEIDDVWGNELNITNTWDKVFDEGISKGCVNWQLVGSRKPENEAYRLTGIYTSLYDSSDDEFQTTYSDASVFDMEKDIFKLSARYPDHYEPFLTNAFLAEYNEAKQSVTTSRPASRSILSKPEFVEIDPLSIRTREQLDAALKNYLDNIPSDRYSEVEAYNYVMTLPPSYYAEGSYDKWFKVGCALRNTSAKLFIAWLKFSSQSPVFSFTDVPKLWDDWRRQDKKDDGLKLRSIMYWSHLSAPQKFKEVHESSIDYYIDQSLDGGLMDMFVSDKKVNGSTDWDIANVLYHFKKDQFVCSSVKDKQWFQFMNHRWVKIDDGTSLRTVISTELRKLYGLKAMNLNVAISAIDEDDEEKTELKEALHKRFEKAIEIHTKLGRTPDKRNLMDAAKDRFYDKDFDRKMDTNPYLLCCSNGVWDFKEKIFRDGRMDDYISMTTDNEYNPLKPADEPIIKEINTFMEQLFPVEELREYMWTHLASTLVGTAVNQTFNNYIGGGRNGKSVLVTLMTKVLGEYKGELPLSAVVTQKRTQVGGTAPEITALKGKRYAVMQEPRQGDILNEGILKELTSGHDAVQARGLYSSPITFIPQFKLVVCANVLPEIKAQDHGTWRRIRVVPFMSLFTENPVEGDPYKPYQFQLDSTINEKFDTWKTVFLAMLVQRVLETDGIVTDCETVLKASNDYKNAQDVLSQFVDEKIERAPGQWIKQNELNEAFKQWHLANHGSNGPKPKELHTKLDQMFGPKVKNTGWRDARIIYDNQNNDGPMVVDDDEANI